MRKSDEGGLLRISLSVGKHLVAGWNRKDKSNGVVWHLFLASEIRK